MVQYSRYIVLDAACTYVELVVVKFCTSGRLDGNGAAAITTTLVVGVVQVEINGVPRSHSARDRIVAVYPVTCVHQHEGEREGKGHEGNEKGRRDHGNVVGSCLLGG